MNEIPEKETSEELLVIVNKFGRFLREEGDGYSTWITWVEEVSRAKVFWPHYGYEGKIERELELPIKPADYYYSFRPLPDGSRAVLVKVNTSVKFKEGGPIYKAAPPISPIVNSPYYKLVVKIMEDEAKKNYLTNSSLSKNNMHVT